MNIQEIKETLLVIKKEKDDDEVAHCMEDDLYHDFIMYVSQCEDLPDDIKEMAKLALTSKEIHFSRWCA